MMQQHTTRWSNGINFFFTTNVVRCCMKRWDRLTGPLLLMCDWLGRYIDREGLSSSSMQSLLLIKVTRLLEEENSFRTLFFFVFRYSWITRMGDKFADITAVNYLREFVLFGRSCFCLH